MALVTATFLLTSCAMPWPPEPQVSTSAMAPLTTRELIGTWLTPRGLTFYADGRYEDDGIDNIRSGRWRLHGDIISMFFYIPDERKRSPKDQDDVTIVRVERRSDRLVVFVRFPNGERDTWTKT